MSKRFFALAFAIVLALIWLAVAIWDARQTPRFDVVEHAVAFVLIFPALLLAILGRELNVAVGLLSLAAFLYFIVLVGGLSYEIYRFVSNPWSAPRD